MNKMMSLQGRLSLRLTTLFVLMFVAGMAMLSTRYRADSVELQAARLDAAIGVIAASLVAKGTGLDLPESVDLQGIDVYVIRDQTGRVLLASSDAAAERLPLPPASWRQGVYAGAATDRIGRATASAFARVSTEAGVVTIQVSGAGSDVEISRRTALNVGRYLVLYPANSSSSDFPWLRKFAVLDLGVNAAFTQ